MTDQNDTPVEKALDESPDQAASQSSDESLLSDIGHRLRKARKARGENLDDLVRELKLRKVYLQALEKGDWDALPDKVYAIGFLRQYAAHLKLDLDDEINRIKNRQYKLTRPLTFPDPPIAPSRRWAWIAGACFIVLFIAFNVFNYTDNDSAPELPLSSTAVQPEQGTPPPVNETKIASGTSDAEPDAPPPASETLPPPSAASGSDIEAPLPDETQTPPLPESSHPPVSVASILPLHRYRFEAVNDAVWLQVYLPAADGSGKGEMRKEVLLQAGHHLVLNEPVKQLWVTTGNAGALQVSVDGKVVDPAGSLGEIGKVLHDHQISAEE
ncbi:MAG: DUF4115 domain-containing protein [Mariprofundaceae bacterium]